ncbi:protein TMED8 isoform X2 [Ambystoma mexicanum]|uniref:protein TMED8 isoform X2 n=1 Tax=Ambystoma mexicanum TaxID=8296 RepID=UPI0037E7CEAB
MSQTLTAAGVGPRVLLQGGSGVWGPEKTQGLEPVPEAAGVVGRQARPSTAEDAGPNSYSEPIAHMATLSASDSTQKTLTEGSQTDSSLNSSEDAGKPKPSDVSEKPIVADKEEPQSNGTLSTKKEVDARSACYQVPKVPSDILMIQSEHTGKVDIVQAELSDLEKDQLKAQPPPLAPATTWTSPKMKEFKAKMAEDKSSQMTVRRGEVVTVRVPTHPDGKRVCWEFATDDYDIGFGLYFDWATVTSTAITVQVSESSDEEDEDEEEIEGNWHVPVGDVERGSKSRLRNRYGEIMPVYRRDSHREVQAGSHDYPGEGIYLLKLDNSYSLLRNKVLYFHVYYTS